MTATQDSTATRQHRTEVQVSRVYIKASADAIWTASPIRSGPTATATPATRTTTCVRAGR